MGILVIDVPDKWGMFLLRKWDVDLGGIHSNGPDLCHCSFICEYNVKLHSEKEKKHHVENPKNPSYEYFYHTDRLEIIIATLSFLPQLKKKLKMKR